MKTKSTENAVGLILVFTLLILGHAHAQYSFVQIPGPSASATSVGAKGISGNNIVVQYLDSTGWYSCIYNGISYTPLNDPLGVTTTATGTLGWGIYSNYVVGSYMDAATLTGGHGFLYDGTTYTTLDYPSPAAIFPMGIYGNSIVGYYFSSSNHGFLYNKSTGVYTTLDDPLGSGGTHAMGIDGNNIVGSYTDSAGHSHGFLYNGSGFRTIDDPLGVGGSAAYGISGNTIIGYYVNSHGFQEGFLYNTLSDAYTTFDFPGAIWTVPEGIDGTTIVGAYSDGRSRAKAFEATLVVPEPGVTAIAAFGTLVLLGNWPRTKAV